MSAVISRRFGLSARSLHVILVESHPIDRQHVFMTCGADAHGHARTSSPNRDGSSGLTCSRQNRFTSDTCAAPCGLRWATTARRMSPWVEKIGDSIIYPCCVFFFAASFFLFFYFYYYLDPPPAPCLRVGRARCFL